MRNSAWQIVWEPTGESPRVLLDFGDLMEREIALPVEGLSFIGRSDFAPSAVPVSRGNTKRRLGFTRRLEHESAAESWERCSQEVAELPWGTRGVISVCPLNGLQRYFHAAISDSSHEPATGFSKPESIHGYSLRVAPLSALILPDGTVVTGGYFVTGGYHVPQLPPGISIPPGTTVIITGTPGVIPGNYTVGGGGVPPGGGPIDVPVELDEEPAPVPVITTAPEIGGNAYAGGILTLNSGEWQNATSVTRRWYYNGNATGGTGSSFTIADTAEVGDEIFVRETAYNGTRSATADSNKILITDPIPLNTEPPAISGAGTAGSLLTAIPGSWLHADEVTGEWYFSGAPTGVTASTYVIPLDAEEGDPIFYRETAINDVGSNVADSNIISVAAPYDSSPVTVPAADLWVALSGGQWRGTREIGMTLEWLGLPAGTTVEIWSEGPQPAGGDGSLETGTSFSFQVTVDPVGDPQSGDIDIFGADLNGKDYYAEGQTVHADYPDLNGRAVQYIRSACNSILIRVRDASNVLLAQFFVTPLVIGTTCRMRNTADTVVDQASGRAMRLIVGEGDAIELLVPSGFLVT